MSPYTVAPCWVEKESMNKFVNLKMKLTAVTQAVAEIKRFTDGTCAQLSVATRTIYILLKSLYPTNFRR